MIAPVPPIGAIRAKIKDQDFGSWYRKCPACGKRRPQSGGKMIGGKWNCKECAR